MNQTALDLLMGMSHSPLHNYILPGLTSKLLARSPECTVRLFVASRDDHSGITPHSHRFDFTCLVLRGTVLNTLWVEAREHHKSHDTYAATTIRSQGGLGKYERLETETKRWMPHSTEYTQGDWYSMRAAEIHSIEFSRDAIVLFFEGPTLTDTSVILEPVVDGKHLHTFRVEHWMFDPENQND